MDIIAKSEKKRLQSLERKKQAYKLQGQLIHKALNNLGNTTKNNKIIFDNNIDEEQDINIKSDAKLKRKKINIFDSDEENDNSKKEDNENELNWEKINFDDNMQCLDNRFPINNDPKNPKDDLQKEKEKQLDILESILGKPLTVKNPEKSGTKAIKNGLMIRYDPTENKHCEYEVKLVQSTSKKKNKKTKHEKPIEPKINELPPVEVSKDIYHTMSDNLTQSLKGESFSLLKTLERDSNDTECVENNDASTLENEDKKFRFNFSANKCDSFDEEIDEQRDRETHKLMQTTDTDTQMIEEVKNDKNICDLFEYKHTLFFDKNDVRFGDAEKFFDVEVASKDEFKNLRRELKQIVRTKIRNNEKRRQPWDKKRKIRKYS